MTEEQFDRAKTLRQSISTAQTALNSVEVARVDQTYCLCGKGWSTDIDIPIEANLSVLEVIKDAWTKQLENAKKEYENL